MKRKFIALISTRQRCLKFIGIDRINQTSSEENNEFKSELPTNDTWYPFSSLVDFYLTVPVNSATHAVKHMTTLKRSE